MKINSIVAAVDFSENAHLALDYAIYMARSYSARLTLLHAVVDYSGANLETATRPEHRQFVEVESGIARQKLQPLLEKVHAAGLKGDMRLEEDILPGDAILNHLRANHYDLIVIGTHGQTGIKKWLYGSVAEKVVRYSPIPVLSVPHRAKAPDFKKILVPMDFSDYSRQAAKQAPKIAQKFGASIEFLNVIEQQMHPAFYAGGIESLFEVDPEIRPRTLELMKKTTGAVPGETVYKVLEGSPHKTIVDEAEENGVDLIVMATHGYNYLDHLLLGSTTERVVSHAPCAVLTIERKK